MSSILLWDLPSHQWLVSLKLNNLNGLWQNYDGSAPKDVSHSLCLHITHINIINIAWKGLKVRVLQRMH